VAEGTSERQGGVLLENINILNVRKGIGRSVTEKREGGLYRVLYRGSAYE